MNGYQCKCGAEVENEGDFCWDCILDIEAGFDDYPEDDRDPYENPNDPLYWDTH